MSTGKVINMFHVKRINYKSAKNVSRETFKIIHLRSKIAKTLAYLGSNLHKVVV